MKSTEKEESYTIRWKSMKDVPKDGTRILVDTENGIYIAEYHRFKSFFSGNIMQGFWVSYNYEFEQPDEQVFPKRWAFLPESKFCSK